ncbi:hypothetical protein FGK63_01825 [Ruegeria sediminis]|uniref:Aldehyde-activating protein n=1 Tax=Ruegeria sediminis TaxID=2583820 RepID=A0ABY2X431_9RHOB|nr:DUF6527 family protein [Ruegeria sediminis]TMV09833.1 hypothetical protein FGK63_01825 [Ruegeria sediminis]
MIRAIRYRDHRDFREKAHKGAIFFDVTRDPMAMLFLCPCGCGAYSRITVVKDAEPDAPAFWAWNGSLNDPTLASPMHVTSCGWRGWLRNGYWEAA